MSTQTLPEQISFDSLLPPEMAARAEGIGVRKAQLDAVRMFFLAILAGAFIGVGAIFATTVGPGGMPIKDAAGAAAGSAALPYGITRLLAGLSFSRRADWKSN